MLSISAAIIVFAGLYAILGSLTLLCSVYFFCGCWLYGAIKTLPLPPSSRKIFLASGIALIGLLWTIGQFPGIPKFVLYMPLFMCVVMIFMHIEDSRLRPLLLKNQWIGATSYGNYLWHSPLQVIFMLLCAQGLINIEMVYKGWFLPLYMIFVCLFSYVSFLIFEMPMQRYLKQRFSR
jgi:peptidoglycan/LPS O-acetylase OafA/YrhL